MSTDRIFTNATGAPVADNINIQTAGPRGPALLQDIWLIEKLANFDREQAAETAAAANRPVGPEPKKTRSSKAAGPSRSPAINNARPDRP